MRQRALLQDHQQLSHVGVVETWDQSPKKLFELVNVYVPRNNIEKLYVPTKNVEKVYVPTKNIEKV